MAAIANARDIILAAAPVRNDNYTIPSNATYGGDVNGNVSGTVNFTPVATIDNGALRANNIFNGVGAVGNGTTIGGVATSGVWNSGLSLSSVGALLGGGGGQITNGASIGSLNAGNITTGTLLAARIGAGSIVASKLAAGTITSNEIASNTITSSEIASNSVTTTELNVGTLSSITTNLGTVTSGSISTSGTVRATGSTSQAGSNYSAVFNTSGNAARGIYVWKGVNAVNSSGAEAILGQGSGGGSVGGSFSGSSGATALEAFGDILLQGNITIQTQTINNLTAGAANFVSAANVSGTVANAVNCSNATNASNSGALGGVDDSGWCRGFSTDVGTASASGFGFGLTVQGALAATVQTRASGNNIFIENVSDSRLKTSIKDEKLGLDFINKLRPVTYKWKQGNTKNIFHNFVAQEVLDNVKDLDDGLVIENSDGSLGVGCLTSILTKAVQELSNKLDQANARIDEMGLTIKDLQKVI